MIDKRLIDYSQEYKGYKNTLKEEAKYLSLEDMMSLVEGFLQSKMVIAKGTEVLNNRDKAALVSLEEVYSKYSSLQD